jgi:gliding motility-associated-like protein
MYMLGLNIFTDAFNRMKHFLFFIFLFISLGLKAQVSILADVTSGCNPIRVNFSIQPLVARDTITSYKWIFGNGDTSSVMSPSTVYYEAGSFMARCTINGLNILESDMISIIECSDSLDVPNVFSPNDDNKNDFFKVKTNGINSYSFMIFTRSGTLIYKTESPTIQWDGRSLSGQKMKNGIYFYIIRRMDGEPLNEVKGIVYLFD